MYAQVNRDKKRSRQYEGGAGQELGGGGAYEEAPSLSRLNMDPHGAGDSWVWFSSDEGGVFLPSVDLTKAANGKTFENKMTERAFLSPQNDVDYQPNKPPKRIKLE